MTTVSMHATSAGTTSTARALQDGSTLPDDSSAAAAPQPEPAGLWDTALQGLRTLREMAAALPTQLAQAVQQMAAQAPRRPDLADVQRTYQTADDTTAMWEPKLFGADWLPLGWVRGDRRELTSTEGQLLDNLTRDRGLLGLQRFEAIADQAFATADSRVPRPGTLPPAVEAQIAQLPADEQAMARRAWPANDGHNDAFRHAYWNALLTKDFGAGWTQQFATAHEGLPGNGAVREAMDLYNNAIGRQIAVANPGASDAELATLVQAALDRGELVVVGAGGQLAWSDRVAPGQHGMADPTAGVGGAPVPAGDASAQ